MKTYQEENDLSVFVKNLHKSFKLPNEQHNGIKQFLIHFLDKKSGYKIQHVLKDISFEIKKGEFFGIVGKNGSGKSTLLKLLAEIYTPDSGAVSLKGSLTPFIELGVGFNPELTGRENVYLNGALLGFSRSEMDKMYNDIVNFAELSSFMDQKLKNYSSGMQVRLAFSIAIRAESDILLIDEVLAVGDAAFQQKCFDYFEFLKNNGRTIIFVTHDMNAVKRFCNRAMLLSGGKIVSIGDPDEIAEQYAEQNIENIVDRKNKKERNINLSATINKKKYQPSDSLSIEVSFLPPDNDEYFVNVSMVSNGNVFADTNTKYFENKNLQSNNKKATTFNLLQPLKNFNGGTYDIYLSLHRKSDDRLIIHQPRAASFLIEGRDPSLDGPMRLEGVWSKK